MPTLPNDSTPPDDSRSNSIDIEVSQILQSVQAGDAGARSRLFDAVYEQLRTLASQQMANERVDHTLQATALVNEAYLRIGDEAWENRAHFFYAAIK